MFFRRRSIEPFSGVTISTARFPQFCGLLLFLWLSVLPSLGLAQQTPSITAADTSSPRDTLKSFIEGCNAIYEIIERDKYLDQSSPEHSALLAGLPQAPTDYNPFLNPDIATERRNQVLNAMVGQGYIDQATNDPDRYLVIDARADEEVVFDQLIEGLKSKLK